MVLEPSFRTQGVQAQKIVFPSRIVLRSKCLTPPIKYNATSRQKVFAFVCQLCMSPSLPFIASVSVGFVLVLQAVAVTR
jgi:hypothetical protein